MVKGLGKEPQAPVINMKVNIKMIKNKDTEYSLGQQVIYIKEIINKIWDVVMDKCFGMMEAIIKDNGRMGFSMDKDKFMYLDKD